ncbi:MAG: sulfotransferase domain-containing protein [Gemmatimonadota bacterium]
MKLLGEMRRLYGGWSVRRRYRSEIDLLAGRPIGAADRPSAVLHTVERAASRFVTRTLGQLAKGEGLVPIDLDSYHYEIGEIRDWIAGGRGGADHVLDTAGCFFGPFRTSSANVLALRHRGVLVVRDPRDVLVSLHHNYGWEPRDPIAGDAKARAAVRSQMDATRQIELDDFVLDMATESHVRDTFEAYGSGLLDAPHVLCVTYEEMVADFTTWLDRIVRHLEWSPDAVLLDQAIASASFAPRPGAVQGRREVLPGGYARTLRPDTIDALDRELGPLLRTLGYSA